MNFLVCLEHGRTGATWHCFGENRVAVVVMCDHHISHAGRGAAEELAGLIRVDLACDFCAGQENMVASFFWGFGLLVSD